MTDVRFRSHPRHTGVLNGYNVEATVVRSQALMVKEP